MDAGDQAQPRPDSSASVPGAGRGSRILANTGYRTLAELGSKVATLALYVVLARRVGTTQFGAYTLAVSLVTIATALGAFGQDVVLTREVARERPRVHDLFANTFLMRLALSLPIVLLVLGVGSVAGLDEQTRVVGLLLGLGVVADVLTNVCFAIYQAHERFGLLALVLIAQRWLTAIFGIGGLALGGGIETVAFVYLVAALGALVLSIALLLRRIVVPRWEVDFSSWLPLFKVAAPIGLTAAFYIVIARADAALLAAYKPESVVGEYGAAYRLVEGTLFIAWSVTAGAFPAFSRAAPTAAVGENVLLARTVKLAFAPSLLVAVVAGVFADPLIRVLFGVDFAGSASALALLAPAIALYPLGFVVSYWLVARDRQGVLIAVYAGAAALNVALNVLLIPSLSLAGAALAVSVSQLAIAVAVSVYSYRERGRVRLMRTLGGSVAAAIVAMATMVLLRATPGPALVAGIVLYVLVLFVIERVAYPEDAAMVTTALRRRLGR